MKSTPAPRPPQAKRLIVLALSFILTFSGGCLTAAAGGPGEVPPMNAEAKGSLADGTPKPAVIALPPVTPLFDSPLRDTSVCVGPDKISYLTGTTGHPT
jgi:hypothetical protein